jgi:hypothetical protein
MKFVLITWAVLLTAFVGALIHRGNRPRTPSEIEDDRREAAEQSRALAERLRKPTITWSNKP